LFCSEHSSTGRVRFQVRDLAMENGMGQAKPIRRSKVLVVEDDDEQRFLVGTLFEESGFEVVDCESAEEALALLRADPDGMALVFSDVRLNGRLDGVDLAQSMRSDLPDVPVILTSGDEGARVSQRPENTVFLQKPWRPLDLLVRAERLRSGLRH
jgi:DNA-binding NtrC family response regulator